MRRLKVGRPAILHLEEEEISCRAEAVADDGATLAPRAAADAGYIPSLGRAATLAFDADGERVRVTGAVRRAPEPGRLRFTAGEGHTVPQRRQAARVGIELALELTVLGDDGRPVGDPRTVMTTDVSLGGIGARIGDWALTPGALVAFGLELPTGPPIAGTALVLRAGDGDAGLELAHVTSEDRARLATFLIVGLRRT